MLDNRSDVTLRRPFTGRREKPFNLRRERMLRGHSQRSLAETLGLHTATIRKIERHSGVIRPGTAKLIADYFDVSIVTVAPHLFKDDE